MPLEVSNRRVTQKATKKATTLAFATVIVESSIDSVVTAASIASADESGGTDEIDDSESIADLRKGLAFTTIVTVADTVNHAFAGILDLSMVAT